MSPLFLPPSSWLRHCCTVVFDWQRGGREAETLDGSSVTASSSTAIRSSKLEARLECCHTSTSLSVSVSPFVLMAWEAPAAPFPVVLTMCPAAPKPRVTTS